MRRLLCCLAVLAALGPAWALAEELPIHDCLEGGSMDWVSTDSETATPTPSTGS